MDLNATQAAIRAGYSRKAAKITGHRLLTDANVRREIQKGLELRRKRVELDSDSVLKELARLAFANICNYIQVQPDGSINPSLKEISEAEAAGILSVKWGPSDAGSGKNADQPTIKSIKMNNKLRALELLCKHSGLLGPGQGRKFGPDSEGFYELQEIFGLNRSGK